MKPTTVILRHSRLVLAISLVAVGALVTALLVTVKADASRGDAESVALASHVPKAQDDPKPVELGVRFSSSVAGAVTGLRFYASAGNVGAHAATMWSASGARLATVTVDRGSPSGWQTATFPRPVRITPGTGYVVSYFAPHGHYSQQEFAFEKGRTTRKGTLTMSAGVYAYGSRSTFPRDTWHASDYYVEPSFVTALAAPLPTSTGLTATTPPTPTPTDPGTSMPWTPPTSVTPPPSPSPTGSPTSRGPGSSAFPTRSSTGWQHTGVDLTPYTGPSTITARGTVIDGKDIRTCLTVMADDVTIRRSRISCDGSSPRDGGQMLLQQADAYTPGVSGLTVTDVEITRPAGSVNSADYGILLYGSDVTITRVSIHDVTSGIHFSGRGVVVQDSYIGGLVNISGVDHNDGVIANGGAVDVTLRHNTLEVPLSQTTPIAMYPEGEPNSYWVVDDNLLSGGAYCIYPSYTKGAERPNHHITITNNVFSRKFFSGCGDGGPVAEGVNGGRFSDGAANEWADNRWQDSGGLVSAG